jgi:hypothetical protein
LEDLRQTNETGGGPPSRPPAVLVGFSSDRRRRLLGGFGCLLGRTPLYATPPPYTPNQQGDDGEFGDAKSEARGTYEHISRKVIPHRV